MIRHAIYPLIFALFCVRCDTGLHYQKQALKKGNKLSIEMTRSASDIFYAIAKKNGKFEIVEPKSADYHVVVSQNLFMLSFRISDQTGKVMLIRTALVLSRFEDAVRLMLQDLEGMLL